MKFGERVKYYRQKIGMTQQELAIAAGFTSKGCISRIESGKRSTPVSSIKKIAQALNVPISALIAGDFEQEQMPSALPYEYLFYLMKADEPTLKAVRKLLDMPELGNIEK